MSAWQVRLTAHGLNQLTPHHAFNPTLVTVLAVSVALAAVGFAVVGQRFSTRVLLVGGGTAYAATMLGLWAGVRLVFWRFAFDPVGDAPFVVPVLLVFGTVIGGQFVVPTLLSVRYTVWTPVVWLFGMTWGLGEFVLLVGGESGGLFALLVWIVGLLPVCLGVLVAVAGGEILVRHGGFSEAAGS